MKTYKALIDGEIKHQITKENFERQTFNLEREILKYYKDKNKASADNIYSQKDVPSYQMGMMGLSTVLGIVFSEDVQKIFFDVPYKWLEKIGEFLQKNGQFGADIVGKYLSYTHESPRHILQYEEQRAQIDHQYLEQCQHRAQEAARHALDLINMFGQLEKSMVQ